MASSRLFVAASGQGRSRSTRRVLLTALLLFLVLFTALVAPWPLGHEPTASAAAQGNPNPPLKAPAWLKPPKPLTPINLGHVVKASQTQKPTPPVAQPWPVSMRSATIALTAQGQRFLSSDGQLEIDIAAATVSAAQLQQAGGSLFLHVRQILPASGGALGDHLFFGTYELYLQDASGKVLTTIALAHPLTLRYHLRPDQGKLLYKGQTVYAVWRAGDASTLLTGLKPLTSQPIPYASKLLLASVDSSGLVWSVSSTLTAATAKTASGTAVQPSTITFGTQAPQANWGSPTDSQVDLNSGGLTYQYPLMLPPGPGGFTPPLTLSYSSGSVNESHNVQATAPWVGEGWNLSLGSISWAEENVTPGGTNRIESVWHISDPTGISGQLIPPDLHDSTADTIFPSSFSGPYIWHTAPESHAKVDELLYNNYPCWRVYLPTGVMEEFGCVDEARQSYVDTAGNVVAWRWDLDLMIDAHGNQIHIHYNREHLSAGYVRDAVLSSVEYDDPTCHNTTTACSTWNPLVKIVFNSSSKPAHFTNTGSACLNWSATANTRCDDPVDLSGSGGLPAPKVFNAYVLNNVQVMVQSNLLHEYDFTYEQTAPQSYQDPATGQQESISGYLDLTQIQEKGTGGSSLNAPVTTISYLTRTQHYEDSYQYAQPVGFSNCGESWMPRDGTGCFLWSRSYSLRYIQTLDNGRGWNETISWTEARNNTHGVNSGAANDAFACAGQTSATCAEADDHNWSRLVVQQRQAVSNGVTSTWSYQYSLKDGLSTNSPGTSSCTTCHQGYTWGNQNDNDYADYYNGQFMSFAQAQVTQPDGSSQTYTYGSTNGWGLANASIQCPFSSCSVAPYSSSETGLAGKVKEEDDYDSQNKLLKVQKWSYSLPCPPPGVAGSKNAAGGSSDPGGSYLFSELDQNNPVMVCDPRLSQQDQYLTDGVTSNLSDARVVHTSTTFTYDNNECGSNYTPGYDYGNVSQQDETANDVSGAHEITLTSFCPMDNVGGGSFLTDLPVKTVMQDASGTQYGCHVNFYGGSSNYQSAPSVPDVTRIEDHTGYSASAGCSAPGSLVVTLHTYDASGNAVTATDPDNHLGCSSGSNTYSACATYDSGSFDTHLTQAVSAANQATTYGYDSTAAGGFGQWLTAETDPNGQTTSYQYDVLGRLTAVIRPGDSASNPTVTYTYINNCTSGSTSPCIELDITTTFNTGSSSTTQQWYDGWGHLVETQAPSPNSGKAILTYTVYDVMGRPTTQSLPYSVSSGQGYLAPDLTKARTVTSYDGLGRSLGTVTYSDASTIVLESTLSYTLAQGVPTISSESSTAYAQTITLDAYNHQSISYTDGLGRTRYTQVFKGTSSPYNVTRTVADSYDTPGNITQVQTDDSSGTVQASYNATFDGMKRLTGFNDSDLGSCSSSSMPASCSSSSDTAWTLSYDGDGNLLSQTDPRNQTTYTSYDVLDRPLCRGTTSGQVNPCQSSAYAQYFYDSYDHKSNPSLSFPSGCSAPTGSYASDPIGHVSAEVFSSSAGNGWRCYGYDARGQLDQSTLSVTADSTTTTQTMNMAYNDQGELTQLVYGGSTPETVTATYDSNGYFQSAYFGTPSTPNPVNFLVGQASYTNWGELSGLAIGGSGNKSSVPTPLFSASYSYDGIQRLQSSSATLGSQTFWNQSLTYDNVGNILQLNTTIPTLSGGTQVDNQSFCYDALDRLVWAGDTGTPTGGDHCGNAPTGTTIGTSQQSFSYDDLDRMTSGPMGTVGYNNSHVHAANSLSSTPNKYATYDDMGNMTCRNVDTTTAHVCNGTSPTGAIMTYDNEGRLATWTAPSGTTASDSFLYDNEGNRVLQRTNDSNGITDTITFDGYTETVINGSSTTLTKYYSAAGQRIATRVGNTLSYLLSDQLGSTTIALSNTGSVTAVQLFAPFGSSRYSQGTMPTDYNFTGQRLDSETGLLYYGARYYDPISGRFTQADLVQNNAAGMDPYAYVGENPESRTDPTGRYYSNETPITQQGGAIGYIGNDTITTVTNDAVGSVWTADDQFAYTQGSLAVSTYTYQQAAEYGGYDPLTDAANSTGAKISHELGLDALQQTWSNPNATWQDKVGAVGQFALTNLNNAFQLAMIFGGPEDEVVDAGGEEGFSLLDDLTTCEGLSFTPATPVATSHGEQAIGTMKVGEKVWAYNPKTKKMELQSVQHIWINHDNDLVDLTLTTTSFKHGKAVSSTSEIIHTNKKHPFLTKEKGFLPVGQIKLGMHVLRADGLWGMVTGWKVVPGTKVMYNLEVAQDHTFTVGTGEWVVHNCANPIDLGVQRVEQVKNLLQNGQLIPDAGKFVQEGVEMMTGLGSTDIDLETEKTVIEIGGPAKSVGRLSNQLAKLSIYALQEGKQLYFAYDESGGPISDALQAIADKYNAIVAPFKLPGIP